MRLNNHPELLKVGDAVTTDFHQQPHIVYVITHISKAEDYGSGYCASVSGKRCPTCKLAPAPIGVVDASWFIPLDETTDLTAA